MHARLIGNVKAIFTFYIHHTVVDWGDALEVMHIKDRASGFYGSIQQNEE